MAEEAQERPERKSTAEALYDAAVIALWNETTDHDEQLILIFNFFQIALLSYISRKVPASDVDDVLQTTMLKFTVDYRDHGSIRFASRDLSEIRAFLFTCAYHNCMDLLRQKVRDKTLGSEASMECIVNTTDPNPESSPSYRLENDELRAAVDQALAALRPEHRDALLLKYVHGCTAREIADLSQTTDRTINMLLHRVRNNFRGAFKGEDNGT